jgi:pimeloyl-ACP methyl ester carboxylesterase
MKIQTNDVSIHVRDTGQGDLTLVFLHYWGGSSRTWRYVTDVLSDRFRTIATDHRGWGQSDEGDGNYSIDTLATDALGVINALGLERYVLVGHSMGGKVVQLMASQRPKGLLGIVLVAPASPSPAAIPEEQRQFISHVYDSRESILAACEQVLTSKTLSKHDLEQVVEDSLRGTIAAKIAWPMRIMMEDITTAIVHINVPVLIIAGEHDKVDPVDALKSNVLAHLPEATMQTLPGVGHLSPLEAPHDVAVAIVDFVGDL